MKKGRQVIVQDGNVEKALRKFKKKISDMGILQEVRDRQQYTKPTTKRKLAQNQARRRWSKYLSDKELPRKFF